MSFNLLEVAKNYLSSEFVSKTASSLGESESGVEKALSGALPAIISGLISKVQGGSGGLIGLIKNGVSNTSGANILQQIFGEKTETITQTLAGFAGIKSSSASSILQSAAPAAVTAASTYARDNHLDTQGIISFLGDQKNFITNAIPAGLGITGLLSSLGPIGSKISDAVSGSAHFPRSKTIGGNKWLPVILVLAVVLLAWYLFKGGCNKPDTTVAVSNDSTIAVDKTAVTLPEGKVDSLTGDYVYNTGAPITIQLPNNAGTLNVGEQSTEAALFRFLSDNSLHVDTAKGNWFNFTGVSFKTGGATITDASLTQLHNLALIMKAFPGATFKIGGYTDNTGDSANNVTLSQKRAEAVAAKLSAEGVKAGQITSTAGYGPLYPVGDNSTPEGRAINRRVAVNVKSK
ncbi:OmpA family protein [Chitinophaga sp.]|uniref:OmpA family protein n=1 Tax=Chitinophaga sp. TaxID=1869181 RepID=UPI0031DDDEDA